MAKQIKDMVFMDVISFAVTNEGRSDNDNIVPFAKDLNGYLSGRAIVAAVGVQNYRMKDGKVLRVLRHPDDVFDSESMASMAMLPLVVKHPKKNFDALTIQGKQVGSTGEGILNDAYYLYAPITVTGQKAQDGIIDESLKELSLGYKAGLLVEAGTWQDQEYDARQVNIRGNHLAIVKTARAGKNASFVMADDVQAEVYEECDAMLMDSIDTSLVFKDEQQTKPTNKPGGVVLMKYVLKNGQQVEADQAFIDSYTALLENNVELADSVDTLTKSESKLKATVATKEVELKDSADAAPSHEDINSAAKELISIRAIATKAEVTFKDEDDVQALKIATIKKVMPDAEFEDDSESDVKSFFSASTGLLAKQGDKSVSNRRQFSDSTDTLDEKGNKKKKEKVLTAGDIMDDFHTSLCDNHLNGED